MNLPTEEIKSATIFFKGDPSVGIASSSFDVELYVNTDNFNDPEEFRDYLIDLKKMLIEAYDFMQGDEPPYLLYDFEMKRMNEVQDKLTQEL